MNSHTGSRIYKLNHMIYFHTLNRIHDRVLEVVEISLVVVQENLQVVAVALDIIQNQ